jgi:hypothetical protein
MFRQIRDNKVTADPERRGVLLPDSAAQLRPGACCAWPSALSGSDANSLTACLRSMPGS